jgi:hypothetical protein
MTKNERRWSTCLHEAGHIVIARALNGWNTTARAVIREDGCGGVAILPKGLSAFAGAVATAAGVYGERLAFDPPRRRRRPPLPPATTASGLRQRAAVEIGAVAAVDQHRQAIAAGTDADRVARYCIALHADAPDEWRGCYDRVHEEAGRLVWELRAEIERSARRLFNTGEITLPGDPDHDAIFAGGAVADGE